MFSKDSQSTLLTKCVDLTASMDDLLEMEVNATCEQIKRHDDAAFLGTSSSRYAFDKQFKQAVFEDMTVNSIKI